MISLAATKAVPTSHQISTRSITDLQSTTPATSPSHLDKFARGHLSPLLYKQALSHQAFHSAPLQQALANLFAPPKTVLIIGVEFGNDVKHFASAGYRVIAFEPMPRFLGLLRKSISKHPEWDVQLHPYAAGNETSSFTLKYQDLQPQPAVPVRKVDDFVDEEVAVMSVDIQGDELGVLTGAKQLLERTVGVVWVEAMSCNERVLKLLEMLDDEFVFFDFVPWGRPLGAARSEAMIERRNYHFDLERPAEFGAYVKWLCKAREENYRMLQTDLVGVRRNRVMEVAAAMGTLGDDVCNKEGSQCTMRLAMKEAKE